jgi:hypothetical protein
MATEEAKGLASDLTARELLESPPDYLELLPVEPTTGIPLPPKAQPGYYPGYSTLSQQQFWDEATRRVVRKRVHEVPPMRFFTAEQAGLLQAVLDRILPQDDRDRDHRIPILPFIDERLYTGRIDGYRYDHMPPDAEAYRLGLQAIETIARHLHGKPFVDLGPRERDEVLITIHDGHPPAAHEVWERMSVKHFWTMLVQDAVEVYYAHPYAWDEIGFGGPAYPRGYMRQERGEPEPWEVEEQRYAWAPPRTALSVGDTSDGWAPPHPGEDHPAGGQGGTH